MSITTLARNLSVSRTIVYLHLAVLGMLFGALQAAGSEPSQPPSDAESIRGWVRQLSSDRFFIRENATRRLMESGLAAVEPVKAEVLRGHPETGARGLAILRELALRDHLDAATAEAAIRELAEPGATAASQRAHSVLESLNGIRTQRGQKILENLGATFSNSPTPYNDQVQADAFVTFGEKWHGRLGDLDYLAWLTDYERIHFTLLGPFVTDAWLEKLAHCEQLVSLQINRARVTDEGLRRLSSMPKLEVLSLRYTPFSAAATDPLAAACRLTSLEQLSVYGTQISADALSELAESCPTLRINYRRGGFLGVSGERGVVGCQISTVQPNQAADQAGIRPGDVVLSYRGQPVTAFSRPLPDRDQDAENEPTLAELIGADPPGQRVVMRVRRGVQELAKEVVLGEWP